MKSTWDDLAWKTIHARRPIPLSRAMGRRPRNYAEIERQLAAGVEFEHAWSDFLHAFYCHRVPSMLCQASPLSLPAHYRAMMAGAAEWLAEEFGLPYPAWVDAPEFFLAEVWDVSTEYGVYGFEKENLAAAPWAFRKRNVAYPSRDLIRL